MGKDDWRTESWLLDYFRDWDDPCPNEGTDGLLREWGERVYLNPPYSNPKPWVERAILEARRGKTIVLLLRHDSSTEWWRLLHQAGAVFAAIIGRLHFSEGTRPPFPSVLVFLRPKPCPPPSSSPASPPSTRARIPRTSSSPFETWPTASAGTSWAGHPSRHPLGEQN